jgi:hypothetical protein
MGASKQDKKYNILYKTTNLINGKIYVGVHASNKLHDKYIGDGVTSDADAIREKVRIIERKGKTCFINAVLKYGYKNFKRENLQLFDTEDEAYLAEENMVDQAWVDADFNYNLCLGGRRGPANWGKDNHKFRGLIYAIDMNTDQILGEFESACEVRRMLGANQARVSGTLRGEARGWKHLFFSREPHNWKKEREDILLKQKAKTFNNHPDCVEIACYDLTGELYKTFPSKIEACRYFGKGKHGVCYLDDVIDKFRKDKEPLKAWGYVWKRI